jgi:hypothetical protein
MSPEQRSGSDFQPNQEHVRRWTRRGCLVTACVYMAICGGLGVPLKLAVDKVREAAAATTAT